MNGVSSPVASAVPHHVSSQVSGVDKNLTSFSLPREGLLLYSRTPTTWLDTGWESDVGWEGELIGWGLSTSIYGDVDTDTRAFFFSDADTPIVRSMADILAWSAINQSPGFAFAATGRGLAVYKTEPSGIAEEQVRKYFRLI